jgi:hypothetical protein
VAFCKTRRPERLAVLALVTTWIGAVLAAIAIWKSDAMPRWSGIPFALGFALYVPQFFTNQPIRVAHGVLVAAGCLSIAAGMWRRSR